jgi:colanic acid/amylovoran biosynthesis glycosyltransferase
VLSGHDLEPGGGGPVAYVLSRFPKTTETFIFREIDRLEQRAIPIEVFAFVPESGTVVQPEARRLADRVVFGRTGWRELLGAQLRWVSRSPATYLRVWRDSIVGNWRSPRFLLRAVVVVPMAARLAEQVEASGCRRIHAHYATHTALAALVASALTDRPFSFTAHAHDLYVDRTMLGTKIDRADFVVTVSEHNRALIEDLYGPVAAAKTHVVRCGVDARFFDPGAAEPDALVHEARAGLSGEIAARALRVVSVGSLEPYKGHDRLIQACGLLTARGHAVRLEIVGEGPERPRLRRLVDALGLDDVVVLLGARDRDEVRTHLADADCFALASIETKAGKKEGIPVALMEAMAMGLPVVGSDLSGIPELVVHEVTGLLSPPGAVIALADALERIDDDRAWARRLGANGRERVRRSFDLQTGVDRLAGLFGVPPVPVPPVAVGASSGGGER